MNHSNLFLSHAAARCVPGRYSMTASFDESTSASSVFVFAEVPSIIPKGLKLQKLKNHEFICSLYKYGQSF